MDTVLVDSSALSQDRVQEPTGSSLRIADGARTQECRASEQLARIFGIEKAARTVGWRVRTQFEAPTSALSCVTHCVVDFTFFEEFCRLFQDDLSEPLQRLSLES